MSKAIAGVDNTARRKWDKDEYAARAESRDEKGDEKDEITPLEAKRQRRFERDPLHQGLIVKRANLRSRDYELDLTSRLGKTQVITVNTPLNQQAGYYCNVCDCILRDSQSYLDHINGKWHNRALGMSMRVERSTVDQVRKRFEQHKEKRQQGNGDDYVPDGFEARVKAHLEEEERQKEERRQKKKQKQVDEKDEDEEELDPDMSAIMGFGGFGSSKK